MITRQIGIIIVDKYFNNHFTNFYQNNRPTTSHNKEYLRLYFTCEPSQQILVFIYEFESLFEIKVCATNEYFVVHFFYEEYTIK